jgi:hypothetical protein
MWLMLPLRLMLLWAQQALNIGFTHVEIHIIVVMRVLLGLYLCILGDWIYENEPW